ncbi:MAG: hypothetical protein HY231_00295 [Acidobacteria bacterium]|nr:hypothetical protein [Acidobacteriota bacterium]
MTIEKSMPTPSRPASRLTAKVVSVAELSYEDKARMLQLMQAYYDNVSREQFLTDLAKKSDVILLIDKNHAQIQGFSTLLCLRLPCGEKTIRGIFSGDTVVDKQYWGQRLLGKTFLRFLFKEKLRHPFEPLYWLLISKGYKTYLMMANNFSAYYPRFDKPTPADQRALLKAFYSTLYPNDYDAETGLIKPAVGAYQLKVGVAAISSALLTANPKVAFFQQVNPDWPKGAELACLARMTLWMPLYYALKVLLLDRVLKPLSRLVFWLPKERKNE